MKDTNTATGLPSIVHLGKFNLPEVGGIEAVIASVAEAAVATGLAVSVICFHGRLAGPAREVVAGVHVVRTSQRMKIASQPLGLGYVMQTLRLARPASIVHLHAPNLLAALCSLWLSQLPCPSRL